MTRRPLHAVPDEPAEQPIDIGALMRLDRDDPKRWARVHTEGDRNPPLHLFTRIARTWRR